MIILNQVIKHSFSIIRTTNKFLFKKEIPNKLAIYFHEVQIKDFDRLKYLLGYFIELGYKFVNPKEYIQSKEKVIFLSFDDNYFSWLKLIEVLANFNIVATFYVNSGYLRDKCTKSQIESYAIKIKYDKNLLTLDSHELLYMSEMNFNIGSHSLYHNNLIKLNENDLFSEIVNDKICLEELLQKKVSDFSFPYGMKRYFNSSAANICKKIGFQTISNAIPGMLFSDIDSFNLFRTKWQFSIPFKDNIDNLSIDARLFTTLTGKSAIG